MPHFNQAAYAAGLVQLQQRFIAELVVRQQQIELAWAQEPADIKSILGHLHRLAGAAGSLGFPELAEQTRIAHIALTADASDSKSLNDLLVLMGRLQLESASR